MYICHECGRDNSNNIPKAQLGTEIDWDKVRSVNDNVAVQTAKFFDPTGFSSWPDVGYAIDDYKKGKGSGLNVALNVLGALPVLGKLGRAAGTLSRSQKLAKTTEKIVKANKVLDKVEKVVPNVAKAIGKTSDIIAKGSRAGKANPVAVASKVVGKVAKGVEKVDTATRKFTGKVLDKIPGTEGDVGNIINSATSLLNIGNITSDTKSIIDASNKTPESNPLIDKTKTIKYYNTDPNRGEVEKPGQLADVQYVPISNSVQLKKWKEQSGNLKNGGWLDNYGKQANYNDSKATASPDMRGDGFSNVGRNYSPAWGGQFQNGGKAPLYVESKNDPRYRAYQDSLNLYNFQEKAGGKASKWLKSVPKNKKGMVSEKDWEEFSTRAKKLVNSKKELDKQWDSFDRLTKLNKKEPGKKYPFKQVLKILPNGFDTYVSDFEKPKQEVIVKPTTTKETTKPANTSWKPLTPEIAKGRYEGDLKNMVYRKKADGSYDITYQAPPEVSRQPVKAIQNNLKPEGLIQNNTELSADMSGLRPIARQPKYYDIQENINQPFGGSQTNYRISDLNSITSPDDLGPGNTRKIVPHYQKGGKLKFLQPTSDKLPEGYRIPYDTPSTERASSIGGTNGEPAYLVPEFKYGEPIYDPIEEFKRTGEHLGGPFKTWQEAEEWENTVRHPAVENRETIMFPQEKFQTGGSIPGSVGFTYARTKGIPSNGPYAKKTLASAQNGVDMYGNPITAELKYDQSVNRTNYNPRTNQMIFGNDMPYFLSQEQRDKTLAHENRHAWQFANDRTNFNIVHNPEYAFQDRLKKKPEQPSTDEVFHSYHDRKQREVAIDVNKFKANNPELSFMPDELIYKRFVDNQQYDNPLSVEGEAQYYENTGERSFQNGGEMKYYQNGLDFKPKSISRDGGWLNKYEKEGIIKDDRGQWEHPGEITEIGSNQITMQGVPYDVLGISDTGDTKLMKPGKDYKFKGKKVTEFPMAKNGRRQEQKGLVNLDDLTNFTNYNKQQPAGWLSKYN
jgi:hypothetical protein